jgi:hypothetical protein
MRLIIIAAIASALCALVNSAQVDSVDDSVADSIQDTIRTFQLDTLVASLDLHLAVSHQLGIASLFSDQHRRIHSPIVPAFDLETLRLTSADSNRVFRSQFALLMHDYWLHACRHHILNPDSRDIHNEFKTYSPVYNRHMVTFR